MKTENTLNKEINKINNNILYKIFELAFSENEEEDDDDNEKIEEDEEEKDNDNLINNNDNEISKEKKEEEVEEEEEEEKVGNENNKIVYINKENKVKRKVYGSEIIEKIYKKSNKKYSST